MSYFLRGRRGANAVEFALLMPIMTLIMGGLIDFGWFFYREGLVTNALRDSVRAGAIRHPTQGELDAGTGACSECINVTVTLAQASLSALGITVADSVVTPTIDPISDTCGMVLEPVGIVHTPLMGLVPQPANYRIRLVYMTPYVTVCS